MKNFINQQKSNLQNGQEAAKNSFLTTQKELSTVDKNDHGILFDLSLVEEMDDNEYVSDILTIFLGNTPKELNDLKNACTVGNYDSVHKMAHKIKGSAGLLQATLLLNILIRIEELAKAETNDDLVMLAEVAKEEYKKIETPLKEHLRNIEKDLRERR